MHLLCQQTNIVKFHPNPQKLQLEVFSLKKEIQLSEMLLADMNIYNKQVFRESAQNNKK